MEQQSYVEWVLDYYAPGVSVPGLGDVYACRKCGALVRDGLYDGLKLHVEWHAELSVSDSALIAPFNGMFIS